jgi:hypothetical protein
MRKISVKSKHFHEGRLKLEIPPHMMYPFHAMSEINRPSCMDLLDVWENQGKEHLPSSLNTCG